MQGLLSEPALIELTSALVRIPSVNPAIAPQEGTGEAAVAAFARDWLEAQGVRAWLEPATGGRPNTVAEVGAGEGPTLVLCAHLDTVGTPGMEAPFAPLLRDGRLFGRGVYDMKGSAAAVMTALAVLARERLSGRVLAALVADEEHASLGAQAFVATHAADGCILTEPSEGDLVLAHKGFAWFTVTVRGRAAHGSRWDLGESAIENAAAFVAAARRHDREVLRRRTAPLVGPASQHVAMISGGSGWSTYAEQCTVHVERRTLPGEDPGAIVRELEELVSSSGVDADVEEVLARPPLVCDPRARVAVATREAMREVLCREPREAGVAYWMDAALFAAAGIPTVAVGPTGGGAHEPGEWVEVRSLLETARILVAASRRFVGAA